MFNFSKFTEYDIAERYGALPASLKTALDNQSLRDQVGNELKTQGLSEEILVLADVVIISFVLGFFPKEALSEALVKVLELEADKAVVASQNILKILAPYLPEIQKFYDSQKAAVAMPAPAPLPIANFAARATAPAAPAGLTLNLKATPAPSSATLDSRFRGNDKPATPAPAPFILQKSQAAEPVVNNSGFRLNLDPKLFGGGPVKPAAPVPPAPRAARLELGKIETQAKKDSFNAAPAAPKVVHYTDPRLSVSSPFGPQISKPPVPPPPPAVK